MAWHFSRDARRVERRADRLLTFRRKHDAGPNMNRLTVPGSRATALAAALLVLASQPLRAETALTDQAETDAEVTARLAKITAALETGERDAKLWWASWLGIFGASMLGSDLLSYTTNDAANQRVERIGAVRSALGVFSVVLVDFPAAHGPAKLRALPESTPSERKAKLRAAETTLRNAAKVEQFGRSWFPHVASIVVNSAFTAWVWAGYHKPGSAAIAFTTGMLASEAKIFTQPTQAIDDAAALLDSPRAEATPAAASASTSSATSDSAATGSTRPAHASDARPQLLLAPMPGGVLVSASF